MNYTKFGNSKIKYGVKKSKRRKTSEIVVSKSGVNIIVPLLKPEDQIKYIIKKHARWIYRKQLQAKEEKQDQNSFQSGSQLPYLGKRYELVIKNTKDEESFNFSKGKFVVKIKKFSISKVKNMYLNWSKQKALPIFNKEVAKFSKKLKVPTEKTILKNHKGKWGSLSKNGTINLNQNLIRSPTKIIDYVVAHEVCHLLIPNHSAEYWNLLESIMPDYEIRKQWLRVNCGIMK